MQKYKNTYISVAFYVLALLFYFILNSPATAPYFICAVIGIFFAHMSNRKKESSWGGNLLLVVGILLVLFPFLIVPLSFMLSGTLYNISH
ncbi:MAG: hypothetical protein A3C79_00830 [Candidatus Taylorbacteria bacterium RIFCSPHIGHO2_02_FULL_45_28]|uniref:Uncharacterized protein n=1 Tax=Candidatus Taylorbacteria bacterium RIFCSPHIGHO2_12_FULL_45_16 TaxID=1802315 RepID=A0A1G2N1Z9_9BACT|nr:MAG: hypothetical protein A2830_02080 [Candidatus Taylorbacteria bacterium RIFCSPHIGHO2_01_FULL_44_110]OHA25564.1 MAG: hypothetical protein A3C79_00830 [Candidatus Taylorbacteria bacterium RIFCSPHIGHO2_02_FULL_45_28]OHA29231.1 MAG: hypothetical protein A3F51_01295 [Candidatus Taylorbacteria bacterium RIFCSPHIGHO2_12_FULL_45_16]OHA33453.1 MAG: hypothetical protein A3A23_02175 [Candidatus Taylorbacteria bacterium RIFCSPLOWO2_01_FULL_45_59]OHA39217.1 MAG: hypothetical protein A3I98_02115 [Candi